MPRQARDLDQARDVSGLVLRQRMPDHPGAASSVSGPTTRAALDQNRRESISSRRGRIELVIELTPSGSAGAVVRLVAVLVWANRLAIVALGDRPLCGRPRALTDEQIEMMRDPKRAPTARLPRIEDAVKAGGFICLGGDRGRGRSMSAVPPIASEFCAPQ
jgi:hypothetical protein